MQLFETFYRINLNHMLIKYMRSSLVKQTFQRRGTRKYIIHSSCMIILPTFHT